MSKSNQIFRSKPNFPETFSNLQSNPNDQINLFNPNWSSDLESLIINKKPKLLLLPQEKTLALNSPHFLLPFPQVDHKQMGSRGAEIKEQARGDKSK